jgi:hypothetical protein
MVSWMSVLWENVLLAIVIAEREGDKLLFYNEWDIRSTYCVYLEEQLETRPGTTRCTSREGC